MTMPIVKAVLGAGRKYIPQKSSSIKTLDTAVARTDIHEFPQVIPPAHSFLLISKKPK